MTFYLRVVGRFEILLKITLFLLLNDNQEPSLLLAEIMILNYLCVGYKRKRKERKKKKIEVRKRKERKRKERN